MYITRLASNEIFSPSNKIHGEIGRATSRTSLKIMSTHLIEPHHDKVLPSICGHESP